MRQINTLLPWFRLCRVPNLLSVPGDPIAGFLLATIGRTPQRVLPLFAAAGASLCLYLFGLILNDLLDLKIDACERPERPLPSGQITVPQARMAAIAMGLSGLNLATSAGRPALLVAALLAALIILYNAYFKRIPVLGVLTMGLCRGTSLLLGACAADPACLDPVINTVSAPVLFAAGGLTLYVVAFSTLARHEMDPQQPQQSTRWLPFLALLILLPGLLILLSAQERLTGSTPSIYIFLMIMALMQAWLLGGPLSRLLSMPEIIGRHIRNLLLVQAAFCAITGLTGLLPALFFLMLSFVFTRLSAHFYCS